MNGAVRVGDVELVPAGSKKEGGREEWNAESEGNMVCVFRGGCPD